MAKNNFNARKLVSFGDPSAAQGGYIWNVVAVLFVLAVWSFYSNWVPASLNDGIESMADAMVASQTPRDLRALSDEELAEVKDEIGRYNSLNQELNHILQGLEDLETQGLSSATLEERKTELAEQISELEISDNSTLITSANRLVTREKRIRRFFNIFSPQETEMFWLPTPAEVWGKSVDLYKNGYRNAKDINPYPWIIDTYAEPWPFVPDRAMGFMGDADALNAPLLDEAGEVLTNNNGDVITRWIQLKNSDPVLLRDLNKDLNEDGELAGEERNYNFWANGMPVFSRTLVGLAVSRFGRLFLW